MICDSTQLSGAVVTMRDRLKGQCLLGLGVVNATMIANRKGFMFALFHPQADPTSELLTKRLSKNHRFPALLMFSWAYQQGAFDD